MLLLWSSTWFAVGNQVPGSKTRLGHRNETATAPRRHIFLAVLQFIEFLLLLHLQKRALMTFNNQTPRCAPISYLNQDSFRSHLAYTRSFSARAWRASCDLAQPGTTDSLQASNSTLGVPASKRIWSLGINVRLKMIRDMITLSKASIVLHHEQEQEEEQRQQKKHPPFPKENNSRSWQQP